MARKPWIVPIPGTRNPVHLRENLGAIDLRLTQEDMHELDTAFARIAVQGDRMNEAQMEFVDH